MLTTLAALLLASSPAQTARVRLPPGDDCSDLRRLEVSPPVLSPPRLCVSPGVLTGILFDQPVEVEIQEEVRFTEVIRGRNLIGFIPPRDMVPGESLRLSAVLGTGEKRQRLTFVLVAHPGQGSHQVEVTYTVRSVQALSDALGQALLANRTLGEENAALKEEAARMRARLTQPRGLSGAYAEGQLDKEGIATCYFDVVEQPGSALTAKRAVSYLGQVNVAVEVLITNPAQESWLLEMATLVNEQGQVLEALRFGQAEVLLPGEERPVFVEFDPKGLAVGRATLTLTGAGGRSLSVSDIVFPNRNRRPQCEGQSAR